MPPCGDSCTEIVLMMNHDEDADLPWNVLSCQCYLNKFVPDKSVGVSEVNSDNYKVSFTFPCLPNQMSPPLCAPGPLGPPGTPPLPASGQRYLYRRSSVESPGTQL